MLVSARIEKSRSEGIEVGATLGHDAMLELKTIRGHQYLLH
jgi:hypothetical protein